MAGTGGLALVLSTNSGVIDISDIIHYFANDNSSFISQLNKGKSRDPPKLHKYFNGATTFASNILFGMPPINFVLYSNDLLNVLLLYILLQAACCFHLHHYLLYNNSTNFLMSKNSCHYILANHTLA